MTDALYGPDLARVHIDGYNGHAEQAAPWIVARLDALCSALGPGLVVDLGCGGGPLLRHLVDGGHQALGVDISPAMVAAARALVPEAEVRCESLATVTLPRCLAVTAVGEPLNYLASPDEQRAVFARVRDALVPGGLFIFDLRLPAPAHESTRTVVTQGDDWMCIATISEDPAAGALARDIVTFVRAGALWRRSDETHRVCVAHAGAVLGWLGEAGFDARVLPGYGDYITPLTVGVFEAQR